MIVELVPTIAVLIAAHNRREKTHRCLVSLQEQQCNGAWEMSVFLVDDGSIDGTADMVANKFPGVRLIRGNGSLFWSGAMRLAQNAAAGGKPSYYMWLNDDVALADLAVSKLLGAARLLAEYEREGIIVVGATNDPNTGATSYGGWKSVSRLAPLRMRRLDQVQEPTECDAMNGNCVLVSSAVVERIGGIDPAFTHGMGDFDFALRARQQGCTVWVAPGIIGSCESNREAGLWTDQRLSVLERWRRLIGPKGLPPRQWLRFTFRHGGWLWWISAVKPYVEFWVLSSVCAICRRIAKPAS